MTTLLRLAGALAVLALAAACSSAPATSTPTLAPLPTPTATPAGGSSGSECDAFPTLNLASPGGLPEAITDPVLEARFPSEIDGQPVTRVRSWSWAQLVCLGGQSGVDEIRDEVSFDLTKLTMASASAEVEGADVDFIAFRLAGGDADELVQTVAQLEAAAGQGSDVGTITTGTAGGKNVYVATTQGGETSYGYVMGDSLVVARDVTQTQADRIFAAFP